DVVIDLHRRNLLDFAERRSGLIVVYQIAAVRLGERRQDLGGNGVDAVGWDDVSHKRLADEVAGGGVRRGGQGIVDGVLKDRTAEEIGAQVSLRPELWAAEIAATERVVGNGRGAEGRPVLVLIFFVVEEEERPVAAFVDFGNPHGTAYRESAIIDLARGAEVLAVSIIRERDPRIQGFVGSIHIRATVELVRAAAGCEIEEPAG